MPRSSAALQLQMALAVILVLVLALVRNIFFSKMRVLVLNQPIETCVEIKIKKNKTIIPDYWIILAILL